MGGLQTTLRPRVRGGLYCDVRGWLKGLPGQAEVTEQNILRKASGEQNRVYQREFHLGLGDQRDAIVIV